MACFRNINTSHGDTERVGLQKLPGPIIVAGKNLHPLLVPTLTDSRIMSTHNGSASVLLRLS
jgi:hypothetical protein